MTRILYRVHTTNKIDDNICPPAHEKNHQGEAKHETKLKIKTASGDLLDFGLFSNFRKQQNES